MIEDRTQDPKRLGRLSKSELEQYRFEARFFEGIVKTRQNCLDALQPLAHIYTELGLYREGLDADRKICELAPDDAVARYNLACSLALNGEPDSAIESLELAAELGYHDREHMKVDPDLESLHGEPRFRQLVRKTGCAE